MEREGKKSWRRTGGVFWRRMKNGIRLLFVEGEGKLLVGWVGKEGGEGGWKVCCEEGCV